jgi:hypothetical protein
MSNPFIFFAIINSVLFAIAMFSYWRYRVEKNKHNPECLPVGTIVWVKLETKETNLDWTYLVQKPVTAGFVFNEMLKTEGIIRIESYQYITPPKP